MPLLLQMQSLLLLSLSCMQFDLSCILLSICFTNGLFALYFKIDGEAFKLYLITYTRLFCSGASQSRVSVKLCSINTFLKVSHHWRILHEISTRCAYSSRIDCFFYEVRSRTAWQVQYGSYPGTLVACYSRLLFVCLINLRYVLQMVCIFLERPQAEVLVVQVCCSSSSLFE